MIVATYNVNSINARLDNLLEYLNQNQPDIVLLQEIKSEFNSFPFFDLQTAGYDVKILGQKSYNGVAILSKYKIKIRQEGLPDFEDENARYIEAEINVDGKPYVVASIYLPNGNPPYNNPHDDSKFTYKLRFMDALIARAKELLQLRVPIILGGDFNVIMTERDVYDPQAYKHDALFRGEVRRKLAEMQYLGYYDAYRTKHHDAIGYTFWEYAGAALQHDLGMRIDYLFLSADAVDMLKTCDVNKAPREADRPSDHTVLEANLDTL